MSNVDLNLLVVFDAVMTERSITGAANRIGMTQPAVSNAVARMRQVWNDPLFVKNGRGIKPTPHAENLWQQTRNPLLEIRQVTIGGSFDPASSTRVFRVGLTEHPVDMIWIPLRRAIETQAPNISIHSVPIHRNTEELLLDASVDLAVHYYVGQHKQIRSSWLFCNKLVCAVRPDHRILKDLNPEGVLPLDKYLAEDHLMVSLSGEARGNVDEALAQQGLRRRVAMTVNHFSLIPSILKDSNLVCVTPQSVVAREVRAGNLSIVPLSFDVEPAPISLLWHTRQDRDAGNIWMRKLISRFANAETAKMAAWFGGENENLD
ncbi:LysR family transcriptional regulator [Kiloniella antarctica]|uniref:LysR family transcriptional regulator n=1 Tax=Kiloniella antarctica TaxID=1550907 RepID=A0ABW5BLC5_9PROT